MDFISGVESVLKVLERCIELIIQFGEAWSLPLVAGVVAWTAWKFRPVLEGLFSRLDNLEWGNKRAGFRASEELSKTQASVQSLVQAGSIPTLDEESLERISKWPRYAIRHARNRFNNALTQYARHFVQQGTIDETEIQGLSVNETIKVLDEKGMTPGLYEHAVKIDELLDVVVTDPTIGDTSLESTAIRITELSMVAESFVSSSVSETLAE